MKNIPQTHLSFAAGALSVILLTAGYEMMSPVWATEVPPMTLSRMFEITKTHDKGGAEIAAECAAYMPAVALCEETRVPVYLECDHEVAQEQGDCDCSWDYDQGFNDGYSGGISDGWQSCETITDAKENPKDEVFSARNLRESKGNLPDYTQN